MVNWNVLAELVKAREVPPQKVSQDVCLDQRLRPQDKDPLLETLDLLYEKLYGRGIDVAMLAVGSSVFDTYHWEQRENLTTLDRFLGKQQSERGYNDIDIRLLPEKNSLAWKERQRKMQAEIQDILLRCGGKYNVKNYPTIDYWVWGNKLPWNISGS